MNNELFSGLLLCLDMSFTYAQTALTQQQKWEEKINVMKGMLSGKMWFPDL